MATETERAASAPEEYDLIIIGAGSGNTIPSPELADRSIAIVDDGERFGGTCLNVGCIPTKMYARPADLAHELRAGDRLGMRADGLALDWAAVRERTYGRIDPISDGGEEYRAAGEPNTTLVRETVRFTGREVDGRHELVSASGRVLRGRDVVIAAGSRPRELDAVPLGGRVVTNAEALRLESLPERVIVIGGGAVASEFASIFSGFGAEVVQLNRSMPLRSVDPDVSATFCRVAAWDIRCGVEVVASTAVDDGVRLELSDGTALDAGLVLVGVGRVPNSDRLDAAAAGIDLHDDGRIAVDAHQRVLRDGAPVAGLWALGDVSSEHQLKHVANEEARIVAANLVAAATGAPLRRNELGPVPTAVFTSPEVAAFGDSLDAARERGIDAFAVRHDYAWTAWGWALADETSFCKLVVERGSGRLVGAQIIGPDAAILIQPLVQAASLGHPVRGLARAQYWPHPAATEVVENALLKAEEELDREPADPADPARPAEETRD
ncbi:MAG: mycothione reductase [Microbacteriaceae bacterium]|nr:mycothione reductase [Microbacteriaceae bacterium]